MRAIGELPDGLKQTMDSFAKGDWGASVDRFTTDAFLIAFLDDRIQSVLGWEASPLLLKGHLGLARYAATVASHIADLKYEVISSSFLDDKLTTETVWDGRVRSTGLPLKGICSTVWFVTESRQKVCGLVANHSAVQQPAYV